MKTEASLEKLPKKPFKFLNKTLKSNGALSSNFKSSDALQKNITTTEKALSTFDTFPSIVNSGGRTASSARNKKVSRRDFKSNPKNVINSFTFIDLITPSFFANTYSPDILHASGYNNLDYKMNIKSLLIQKTDI